TSPCARFRAGTDDLLPDSAGASLNPIRRRFADLLQIPEGSPSELRGASDSSLPGFGRSGYAHGGTLSLGGKKPSGARAGLTGSLFGAEDHAARIVDGHRPTGSQTGPPVGQNLSRSRQSATGPASAP